MECKNEKTVSVFKEHSFYIPFYQRPYSWDLDQASQLWTDMVEFANTDEKTYYMGAIVVCKMEGEGNSPRYEVIDGQQRLTTFQLILRACYTKFVSAEADKTQDFQLFYTLKSSLENALNFNQEGKKRSDDEKIHSEVRGEIENQIWNTILEKGNLDALDDELKQDVRKSPHAINYQYFLEEVNEKAKDLPGFMKLVNRMLDDCHFLMVVAGDQEEALRIFNTLNDRGMPLSDSDIIKSKMYANAIEENERGQFIDFWKELEDHVNIAFQGIKKNVSESEAMYELFLNYMFYLRSQQNDFDTTTKKVRYFFHKYFKDEGISNVRRRMCNDLHALAEFWRYAALDTENIQASLDYFMDKFVCDEKTASKLHRYLWVASELPIGIWRQAVSVYFLFHFNAETLSGKANDLILLVEKLNLFVLTSNVIGITGSTMKNPIFRVMRQILGNKGVEEITFAAGDGQSKDYTFDEEMIKKALTGYYSEPTAAKAKALLMWHTFHDEKQCFPVSHTLQIEHILAKKSAMNSNQPGEFKSLIESIGNKALLEAGLNQKCANYSILEKFDCYKQAPTQIVELLNMAEANEKIAFTEADVKSFIQQRGEEIINGFVQRLVELNLVSQN